MKEKITAIILAGGRARRMAGVDKGLCSLAGRPMIEWTLARIRPQVGAVLINANRNREAYAALGFPVAADDDDSRAGPLAGIHAGMKKSKTEWVLSAPCDSPFLPRTACRRIIRRIRQRRCCCRRRRWAGATGFHAGSVFTGR